MSPEDSKRIVEEAENFGLEPDYPMDIKLWELRTEAYIAGATFEHERLQKDIEILQGLLKRSAEVSINTMDERDRLQKDQDNAQLVVDKLLMYILFLSKEIADNAAFMMVHGQNTPDRIIKQGEEYRAGLREAFAQWKPNADVKL